MRTLSTETQDALAESNTTAEEASTPLHLPPSPPISAEEATTPFHLRHARSAREDRRRHERSRPFSQVISSISTTRAFAAERSEEEIYGRGMKAYQECVVRTARL